MSTFGIANQKIVLDEQNHPVDYTFLSVNRIFETMSGLVAADIVGKRATTIFPSIIADDAFDWIKAFGKVALDGSQEVFEQFFPPFDCFLRILVYSLEPLSFVTIFQHLDNQNKPEHGSSKSEQHYHMIFHTMTEGVVFHEVTYDAQNTPINYRILDVNPAFEAMLQVPKSAVVGKLATEAYGTETAPFLDIYARVADTGIPEQFQTPFGDQVFDIRVFSPKRGQFVTMFFDITEQKRAEQEHITMQQKVIDAQRDALRELSVPLIPIANRVVVLPLVGSIDSQRAQVILDVLLQGVVNYHAETVILDITGVQVVDSQVANALVHSARAVQLLGAEVIVSGISPQVAQTLVHIGVDLTGIHAVATVQVAIETALRRLGTKPRV